MQGVTFPRVGTRGRYIHPDISLSVDDSRRMEAAIEVVSVTASGKTCLVRFVKRQALGIYDTAPFRVYRRGDGVDGSGWYLPHGRGGITGEVVFSAAAHAALPWRPIT